VSGTAPWTPAKPRDSVSLFRDTGVVLRTYRLGEADRIVVFLTERHGKVRAVAKGIRKTTSKFGARLEPLTHVDLLLWQGRSDLDIVNQVEVLHSFRPVREDLARLPRGLALLEVADQLAQERHPDPRLYSMLVGALSALADDSADPTLLAPAFFLKALVLEGAGPVLDACAACGEPDGVVDLVAFDLVAGGTLCRAHRSGRPLSPPALALLRRILGGDLAAVLSGPPPPGADEVSELATEAMEAHLDRRIRSVRSTAGL
jgi:DNA repair protein RecO (recombination protein O)